MIRNKLFDVINAKKVKPDIGIFLLKRVNFVSDKHFDGGCRPQTPALRGSPPPDGGRRDASSGRAWARRFMGDDEVPQLTLDSSQLYVIFPARFCAILYI